MVVDKSLVPRWLWNLVGEKFFGPCKVHGSSRKNEKNVYCLECCASICSHCVPLHASHPLLQVRRYVYHDVVRLADAQKLLDCSLVQPYTTNSAKVVFLKQRPISRLFRGSGNLCATCDRNLQENYVFCSISCKVQHRMARKIRPERQLLPSYDSVRRSRNERGDSGTNGRAETSPLPVSRLNSLWSTTLTVTAEFARKKRSSLDPVLHRPQQCLPIRDIAVFMSRRKGVPHRSPLY
ncbi:hypothetical protein CRG98_030088 [Punica granatum]|uniref:B box-type domain-containing protein n=1 Tax=Punica granatum TaxID=22663 RepID=A0A2I0IZP6_PUNGR|nr:hypothetical protein CRG98_030088 [Punica granatum]